MLENYFSRPSTLNRLRSGPIGSDVDDLATALQQQDPHHYATAPVEVHCPGGSVCSPVGRSSPTCPKSLRSGEAAWVARVGPGGPRLDRGMLKWSTPCQVGALGFVRGDHDTRW